MRDKALKKKLQQLHIPQYDEYKLEKVIVEAKKIDLFSGNQRMTNTEFFLNQLGFISKKVWSLKAFFSISILYLILAKDVYSKVLMIRLIVFGIFDLLFLICSTIILSLVKETVIWQIILYGIVPYEIMCFGCMYILNKCHEENILLYSTTWGICLSSIIIILKISGVELFATCYFAIWLVFGLIAVSGIGVEIKQLLKKTGGNLNEISNGTFI